MGVLDGDVETMAKWRVGDVIRCKVSRMRNPKFHRKYFALLNYAFDHWNPEAADTKHGQAVKNFDRFRKDIAIATGHYELTVNIKGEVRAEANSISFARMDEDEFSQLYDRTIDYLLQKVLTAHNREVLDEVVANIVGFV